MAVRLDLVVYGAANVLADVSDGGNRLASRSRIGFASVASRTPDLRSYNCLCLSAVGAPLHAMVTSRSAKRRAGTASSTPRRHSGAGCLVVCYRIGRAVAHSARLTNSGTLKHNHVRT